MSAETALRKKLSGAAGIYRAPLDDCTTIAAPADPQNTDAANDQSNAIRSPFDR
jgi:hypothetical protein